jgi:hypothetical protein
MLLTQIQSPPPGATVVGWIALCVGEATGVARVEATDVADFVAPVVIGANVFDGRRFAPWPDPASAVAFPRKLSVTMALTPAIAASSFMAFFTESSSSGAAAAVAPDCAGRLQSFGRSA